MQKKILIILAFIIGINLFMPVKNMACPIPVFRYALEYWQPDPYRLEILYKNSLTPAEEKLTDYLKSASEDIELQANFKMRTVNTGSKDHDIPRDILNNLFLDKGAYMVIRYPFVSGINIPVWSAALTKDNINFLLNSPARENIAGKLASGVTAMWMFLESGDRSKDQEALDLITKELKHLGQTLTFPNTELWLDNYQDDSDDNVPKVDFEVISISRDDPREQFLVKMLINSEADLNDFDSEPMVFPIFGRGIILYGIVGKGINEWNIREAAEFITGECSCQAKLLNPGVDMLISMNWDKQIKRITDLGIANPLTGIGDFSNKEEEVRRRLESATLERLGKVNEDTEVMKTDPEKVVYLDIFSDNEQNIKNENNLSDSNSKDKDSSDDKNSEKDKKTAKGNRDETYKGEKIPDIEKSGTTANDFQENSGFNNTIIIVFTVIILIVILSGVIIYLKAVK